MTLVDIPEAARRLGLTPEMIRGRVRRHQLPFVKLGGRIFFSPKQLSAWLEDATVQPEVA